MSEPGVQGLLDEVILWGQAFCQIELLQTTVRMWSSGRADHAHFLLWSQGHTGLGGALTPTWDRPSELISAPQFTSGDTGLAQGYVTCLGGAGSRVALPWGPWHCPPLLPLQRHSCCLDGLCGATWRPPAGPGCTYREEFQKPAHAGGRGSGFTQWAPRPSCDSHGGSHGKELCC